MSNEELKGKLRRQFEKDAKEFILTDEFIDGCMDMILGDVLVRDDVIVVCAGWVVLQILSLGVERIQIEHFQFDDFLNIWEAFCMTHKTEEKNIEFMDNFIKYYLVFWVLNQGSF